MTMGYFLTRLAIQLKIDNSIPGHTGIIDNALLGIYNVTMGFIIYFGILNLTSISGYFISWKRKDAEGKKAFEFLTATTMGTTLIFFLYYYQ
jgi:hypothetical protein